MLFGLTSTSAAAILGRRARSSSNVVEILPEAHCLSEESANGYRKLVRTQDRSWPDRIVLPASRWLSPEKAAELGRRVNRGCWLLVESGLVYSSRQERESQGLVLAEAFNLQIGETIDVGASNTSYVTYIHAQPTLVRTFGAITPICCAPAERIAEFEGIPVAIRRRIGSGGVIFLGSILGVGLLAQEREAHRVVTALLSDLSIRAAI